MQPWIAEDCHGDSVSRRNHKSSQRDAYAVENDSSNSSLDALAPARNTDALVGHSLLSEMIIVDDSVGSLRVMALREKGFS